MGKNNLVLYLVALIGSVVYTGLYLTVFSKGAYKDEAFSIFTGLISFTVAGLYEYWSENRDLLSVDFRSKYTGLKSKEVYVSLSYLFRIKVDGFNQYLVIKGGKIQHQYQPVGGVYQRYPSSQALFDTWSARPARDEHNPHDLRFYVKGKHVPEVIRWFYTRQNREIDVWREFYEELVAPGILSSELFSHVQAEFLYSCPEYLIERKGINGKQVLIYDIYRINLTPEQANALKDLLLRSPLTDSFAFVDEEDLDKGCFKHQGTEYNLGGHTKYLKHKS